MFNLEAAIIEWRQQMRAAGIPSPALEELECHLREDVTEQVHLGVVAETAFTTAVQQLGRTELLQAEFSKVGGGFGEMVRQWFCTLAGIPNLQPVTAMNTSLPGLEPRWVTYLKSTIFVLPALVLWLAACVFVLPKLKELCASSGTTFPGAMITALAVSNLLKNNLFILLLGLGLILGLLEWRSRNWPRYRRLFFGVVVFGLNSAVLVLFALMLIMACIAGSLLLQAK